MFKEIVSAAIIIGWFLNFFYVAHPNTTTYTIAFVISLLGLSPFLGVWWYLTTRTVVLRDEIIFSATRDLEAGVAMGTGVNGPLPVEGDIVMEARKPEGREEGHD